MDTRLSPTWFGPLSPLPPVAPPGVAGRQFDYLTGWNLQVLPRAEAAASPAELRALADSCDLVRLAIETRKDQLTDLQWTIAVRGGGSDARVGQATALLARPDREHAWDEWVRMLVEDMLVLDAATLYPRQALDGSLIALEPLDGGTIKRVLDDDGRTPVPPLPAYQQILKGLPAVDYTADALLYLPRNPRTWRVYGLSPVEQCLLTINIALRRQMHKLEYYTEGSMPDAFLGVPEDWTTEQLKEYQAYWDGMLSGNTAERRHLRFIHGNVRYVETKPQILKDDFDEWLARIVAFAFSISPAPFVRQMNRATAERQDAQALREGLAPLMRWLKRVVDEVLARTMGWPDLELVWRDTVEQDPQKQAEIATSLVAAGITTRNEARATLGLPPRPDGDALTVAGPVTPLARLLDGGTAALAKALWNTDLHPRWPKGAEDSLGGKFAPKGEGTTATDAGAGNTPIQLTAYREGGAAEGTLDVRDSATAADTGGSRPGSSPPLETKPPPGRSWSEWLNEEVPEYNYETGDQVGTQPRWRSLAPWTVLSLGLTPAIDAAFDTTVVPPPIDPNSLPQGRLSPEDYERVGARNWYLSRKYDPDSWVHQVANLVTGAMRNPANVLTPAEKAEHEALSARLRFNILGPPPTPEEARIDAIADSPIGGAAFTLAGLLGADQKGQDLALAIGSAVEGYATVRAGARAENTEFLDTQSGSSLRERGQSFVKENPGIPKTDAQRTAQEYETQVEGAAQDIADKKNWVPILFYTNPNSGGLKFVKFDGLSVLADGTVELIDRKTNIIATATPEGLQTFRSTVQQLRRQSAAVIQNPGFAAVLELPTEEAAATARAVLSAFNIKYIGVRVAPMK
ncbi:MAG TPA: phage portal protein [Stellaceae bacterium]|nr:phage portal protein [Stellaceae bacterium]